jgi:predicted lipoprotein with Yx(FWY)xxD motif
MKKHQRGYSLIETVLILVIVGLIAFIAWYVFHTKSNTETSLDTSAASQTTVPKKKTSSSTPTTTAAKIVQTKTNSKVGQYLADPNGKTLYIQGEDPVTHITSCTGTCLDAWPFYEVQSSPPDLPVNNVFYIVRKDNNKPQYTYKLNPLYYYVGDTSAGMVTGDGVNNFHVAKP